MSYLGGAGRWNDLSRGATHWVRGADEAAESIGLKPLVSGMRTEDEGLFVVQHKYWQEALQRALASRLAYTIGPQHLDRCAEIGMAELLVRLVDDSRELRFFAPSVLIERRENFFNYVVTCDPTGERFHAEYGVCLRDLVPVAEPADVSNRREPRNKGRQEPSPPARLLHPAQGSLYLRRELALPE